MNGHSPSSFSGGKWEKCESNRQPKVWRDPRVQAAAAAISLAFLSIEPRLSRLALAQ
jgi:hypothetical protein